VKSLERKANKIKELMMVLLLIFAILSNFLPHGIAKKNKNKNLVSFLNGFV
jgi:hypothetical protein